MIQAIKCGVGLHHAPDQDDPDAGPNLCRGLRGQDDLDAGPDGCQGLCRDRDDPDAGPDLCRGLCRDRDDQDAGPDPYRALRGQDDRHVAVPGVFRDLRRDLNLGVRDEVVPDLCRGLEVVRGQEKQLCLPEHQGLQKRMPRIVYVSWVILLVGGTDPTSFTSVSS